MAFQAIPPVMRTLIFLLIASLFVASPLTPAQVGKEAIDSAIARGALWLIRTQSRDGSWRGPQFEHYRGFTALCAYTLLKCGYPKDHPSVRAAFDWLERQDLHRTYDLGCALMAYEAYGDDRPMSIVKEYAKKLVRQCGNGSREVGGRWGYPGNHNETDKNWTDLSNTQYAALGLRAARRCGVKAGGRSFWTRVAADLLDDQESYGGFGYRRGQKANGSMTVAGITTLVICRDALTELRGGRATMGRLRAGINRGFMWLDKHWDIAKINGAWHYYYMYGLERVCAFTDKGRVGKHNWHADGSKALVAAQDKNAGHWRGSEADTCFALLFLRRGSRASGLGPKSVLAQQEAKNAPFAIGMNGEYPLIAWVRNTGVLRGRIADGESVSALRWRVDGKVVSTVSATGEEGLLGPKCNLQHPFEKNGTFAIQAEVELSGKDGGEPKLFKSNVLTHNVDAIEESWHLEAIRDGRRQLLEEENVTATASSEAWGWSAARFVADQRLASSWWCKQGDTRPWIRLSLSSGSRAGFLKLAQAHQHGGPLRARARAKDIEVRINNGKPISVRLVDDPLRKQYLRIPKTSVRSIRIDVKSTYRGSRASESNVCGFKEIELYADPHPEDLKALPERLRYLIPIARQGEMEWRYTFEPPSVIWHRPTFKDRTWAKGVAGFGSKGGPTNPKRTDWKGQDIWMRREFRLVPGDSRALKIEVCHDDDVTIHINGVVAARATGWSKNDYRTLELSPEAQASLVSGRNVIAVHCVNTGGEGYVDVGLVQATR